MQCPLVDSIWASFPSLPDNINGELLSCSDPLSELSSAVLAAPLLLLKQWEPNKSDTWIFLPCSAKQPRQAPSTGTPHKESTIPAQRDTSTGSRAEKLTLGCTGLTNAQTYWSSAVCLISKVVMVCILTQPPVRWQKTGKDAGAPRPGDGLDVLCQHLRWKASQPPLLGSEPHQGLVKQKD